MCGVWVCGAGALEVVEELARGEDDAGVALGGGRQVGEVRAEAGGGVGEGGGGGVWVINQLVSQSVWGWG